jgi:hypothetical protein
MERASAYYAYERMNLVTEVTDICFDLMKFDGKNVLYKIYSRQFFIPCSYSYKVM